MHCEMEHMREKLIVSHFTLSPQQISVSVADPLAGTRTVYFQKKVRNPMQNGTRH